MEEKKKLCVFSLVKNGIVFLFLLWMMVMPVEEIGVMGYMHFISVLALFTGGSDANSIVFCIFDVIFVLLWILSLVYVILDTIYAVKGMKNPDAVNAKRMNKTFRVAMSVLAFIMNFLSQVMLYVGIISEFPVGRISFMLLFVLFIVVIVLGSIGKKKTKKAFASAHATEKQSEEIAEESQQEMHN